MYQIHFKNVTFAQASKYVMIIKNETQTKRTQVCNLWTSVPTFKETVIINSLKDFVVKACSATIDRKLSVIGSFNIKDSEIKQKDAVMFEGIKQFTQFIEDQEVCIGNCLLKIVKKKQQDSKKQYKQIDDEFQLKSEEQQEDEGEQVDKCKLKFIFHGGFDFYLNSAFKICINWGSKKSQTKQIADRVAPFWGSIINLQGNQDKIIQITVLDKKNNKLQWMRLNPKQIRIMYPYHLHIYFREEYVGLHPHFYMTIIREDVPMFSVLDNRINFSMKYIGPVAPHRAQQYILIYPKEVQGNQQNRLPLFVDLKMDTYISFDTINSLVQERPDKHYQWTNWNLLIPINLTPNDQNVQIISLLKSFLSKSLVCVYFTLQDAKMLFCQQLWNGVQVIDKKDSFQNSVKQLYYEEKKIVLGKAVQFTSLDTIENGQGVSIQKKWKILTHNYILRKNLLAKTINSIEQNKKLIQEKGSYIEQLKKIYIEVKKMNSVILQKQKASVINMQNSQIHQKVRQNYQQYPVMQIITILFEKQVQLERRKKINDQMRMRMDSLHYFNEDSEQLNQIVVKNSQKLHEQQIKLKQMKKMNEAIPKQIQVIRKMEKMFQTRQIDKSMNDLLKRQENRLKQLRKLGNQNLEGIYKIVKSHRNGSHSLLQNVKAAQQELIRLNAQYAKLNAL